MMSRLGWIALLSSVFCPFAAGATSRYSLSLPMQDAAVYEIPFGVAHPGRVTVEIEWDDPRILALRVEGPDSVVSRRSGPSPQKLEVEVADDPSMLGAKWRVWVRVPPGRETGEGRLSLTLPDAPEAVAEQEAAPAPTPSPPPPPEPWTLPGSAPGEASPEIARLFHAVEAYRGQVFPVDAEREPDGCGWQVPLLRWLATERDAVASGGNRRDDSTRRYLADVADAVRRVEELRTSDNPLLAGPVPEDSLRRRAWEAARRDALRDLERALDDLAERLRNGSVPEFQDEDWPPRFVACLTAAERYFEARTRLGDDAGNRDVADAQWPLLLAAAPALDTLASLPTP